MLSALKFRQISVTVCCIVMISTSRLSAQTVQLPSVTTFSYSGSVLVPDSGAGYLGGRRSAAVSSHSRLGSRASGGTWSSSSGFAQVTIIDLAAMDRQILGSEPAPAHDLHRTTAQRTEEGKRLVRFARSKLREQNQGAAFNAYRMAIDLLPADLRTLATAEFRREFPIASVQVANAGIR